MYWKLRNVCVYGNKSKVRLTGHTTANAEGDNGRYLLILGIKLLLQNANLAISNPRYLELFLDTLESSR